MTEAAKAEVKAGLKSLPPELLRELPQWLESVDDWYNLIRICPELWNWCKDTKATYPLQSIRLGPQPRLALAGSAKLLADWAVKSEENRQRLYNAVKKGNDGLFELSVDVVRFSVDEIRLIHLAKTEVINACVKEFVRQCRKGRPGAKYDYESIPRERALWDKPDADHIYDYIIYCNLFHHAIVAAYRPSSKAPEPLSVGLRHLWLTRCAAKMGPTDPNMFLATSGPEEPTLRFVEQMIWCNLFKTAPDICTGYGTESLDSRGKVYARFLTHRGLWSMAFGLPADNPRIKADVMHIRNIEDLRSICEVVGEEQARYMGLFQLLETVMSNLIPEGQYKDQPESQPEDQDHEDAEEWELDWEVLPEAPLEQRHNTWHSLGQDIIYVSTMRTKFGIRGVDYPNYPNPSAPA